MDVAGQRLQVARNRAQIVVGQILRAVLDLRDHAAICNRAAAVTGLQKRGEAKRAPAQPPDVAFRTAMQSTGRCSPESGQLPFMTFRPAPAKCYTANNKKGWRRYRRQPLTT
jgi:hypothetical protein